MEIEEIKLIQESTAIIKQNESLVGLGLWNIGNELKYIRDNKTYKQLGINTMEEYTDKVLGYERTQSYRMIIIAEKYKDVAPVQHLGMRQLLALAKLDEPERNDFLAKNDVQAMTTRELEAKIKKELEFKLKIELEEQFESKFSLKNDEIKILEEEKAFLENRVTKLEKSSELIKQKEAEIANLKKFLEIEEHNSATIGKSYDRLEAVNKDNFAKLQKAEKELAELKAAEPKVVEKVVEKEVIPDDYEELKKLKEQQEQTAKEIATRERELKKKQDALDEEQMKFLNNRFDRDKILGFRNKLEKANGIISEEIGKIVMLHFEIEDKSKVDENVRKLIQEMNEHVKKLNGLIYSSNQEGIIEGEVLNGTLCE